MAKQSKTDPFISRVTARLAPLRRPEPRDPQRRRTQAAEVDVEVTRALGIVPVDVATADHALEVEKYPDVRVRVYWPGTQAEPPANQGGLPILVYFFGGGFTLGGIDWAGWDASFRQRAHDAGIIVVAADYAHAPEIRFPAQPEQCWTAFEWAVEHARELGGDPEKIAVGGTSSGGNLAAAVALMNRDRSQHPIRLQLLEMAALDLTTKHLDAGGIDANVPGVIMRKLGKMLARQYLGARRSNYTNPYASPLRARSLERLPPAAIYVCEMDPLRGDGEAYARRLAAAAVPTTAVRYIGQTHTSNGLRGWVPAADHMHRDIVATLRTLHDAPVDYERS